MGRTSTAKRLTPAAQQALDLAIRASSYIDLDKVRAQLQGGGIIFTRSSLYRYAAKLRARDAMTATPEEGTVVTIVERPSGLVQVVKTSMPGNAVAALIQQATSGKNGPP
ncbi:UNVERIFIED_ORG: hypothetical protein HNP28_000315 [Comamonas terrigena]